MKLLAQLESDLLDLKTHHLFRDPETVSVYQGSFIEIDGRRLVNFSSNNYLGLSWDPRVTQRSAEAIQVWGAGSGASRLLSGNLKIHLDLERKIAAFKSEEAATVFSSGYLANLGTVTSLIDEEDLVLIDRLSHASLVDAARLSRAKLWVYPHRDTAALSKLLIRGKHFKKKLVLTDSYFSMDGTIAPLDKIAAICKKNGAMLMVDEAHATGVFGKTGRGLTEHFGLAGKIDVVMGTLSKALGSVGGYVAGKEVLKKYLANRARQFIYTTAPSPAASGAALGALEVIEEDSGSRTRLWRNIECIRKSLLGLGFDLMDSEGPIIPIVIGDTRKAILLHETLKKKGIFAPVIRPPTVPRKTDRIRLSILSTHTAKDLDSFLSIMKKIKKILL